MRNFLMLVCTVVCLASIGCCGPLGCGPGSGIPVGCSDCDGLGSSAGCGIAGCRCGVGPVCGAAGVRRACGGPGIARASIDRIRAERPFQQFKRSLVCGSGCGETYIGEWTSTPPDAYDPCCGDQFVGGATKCRPFCWERGTLARGFYGGRYHNSYRAAATGGCGTSACSGGCGGEIASEGYVSESYIEDPGFSHGAAGCSTCDASKAAGGTRVAQNRVTQNRVARSQAQPQKSIQEKAHQARLDQRNFR